MFGADHGLVVSRLHGDVGPIIYLIMEDQFLSPVPYDATACLRVRGCRAAHRHDWQALRACGCLHGAGPKALCA